MTCGKFILTAYLTFVTFTSVRSVKNDYKLHFPSKKSLIYEYFGEVTVSSTESEQLYSQFSISGNIHITSYFGDSNLKNAFFVTLQNATSSSKNRNASSEQISASASFFKALKLLEGPFGVVFSESGQIESITIPETEPMWSKNIKFSWASLLQLNFKKIDFKLPIKSQSFIVPEYTIYGPCKTSYSVNKKYPKKYSSKYYLNDDQIISVTKFTSSLECYEKNIYSFNFPDVRICALTEEENMNQASRSTYEMKMGSDGLLLQKLYTRDVINYYPFYNNPESYYAMYTAKLSLKEVSSASQYVGPTVDFKNIPSTHDWSYQRTNGFYAPGADFDVTNGRHVVDQAVLVSEANDMLHDAVTYLGKNHFTLGEVDWPSSTIINEIHDTLTYLEVSSYNDIFSNIQNTPDPTKKVMRSLFLGIVPLVGTTASNDFAFQIILNKNVSDFEAIEMLAKLPFYVRVPNENLLARWETFSHSAEVLSPQVFKSAVLATGSMVYLSLASTFGFHPTVERNLEHAYQQILNDSVPFDMKVVWLGVIHNIQIGDIVELLYPILSGEIAVSEHPYDINLLAIGSSLRSLYFQPERALTILFSLMINEKLDLKVRIGAYNIALQQSRNMGQFLQIHSFMKTVKNEHLYNFHITTLQGFAKTHCPCFAKMREYSSKILKLIPAYSPVSKNLTAVYVIDTMNDAGDGLLFKTTIVRNPSTKVITIVYFQQFIMTDHKVTSSYALYMQSDGMDDLLKYQNDDFLKMIEGPVTETLLLEVVRKFTIDVKLPPEAVMEALFFYRDQIVLINHYDYISFREINSHIGQVMGQNSFFDSSHVFFQNKEEKHPISGLGTPIIVGAKTPAVFSGQVESNFHATKGFSAKINAQVWLHHKYYISAYNPIADCWQYAEQLSVVNAQVSYQFTTSPQNSVLRYVDSRTWKIKFVEAIVNIHNQEVVSITGHSSNEILGTNSQPYRSEIIVPSATDDIRNLNPINFTDNGKQYEVILFNCANPLSNATNQEYVRPLPRWNNYDLMLFPLSSQFKNCDENIKITESSE